MAKRTKKNSDIERKTAILGESGAEVSSAESGGVVSTAGRGKKRTRAVVKSESGTSAGGKADATKTTDTSIRQIGKIATTTGTSTNGTTESAKAPGASRRKTVAGVKVAAGGDEKFGNEADFVTKKAKNSAAQAKADGENGGKKRKKAASKKTAAKKTAAKKAAGVKARKVPAAKSKKSVKKKAPVGVAVIKHLAYRCKDRTEAGAEFAEIAGKRRICRDLEVVLVEHEDLQAAWEYGRFLRNLGEIAHTGVSISEAEYHLGLSTGELETILAEHPDAREEWNQGQLRITLEVKQGLVANAKLGKAGALRELDKLLRQNIARPSANYRAVSIADMIEITGVTRQTLHDWHTDKGLRRNSDKTYDLVEFFNWFEKFTSSKAAGGKVAVQKMDPLREAKAEKERLLVAEHQGRLLDREAVIAGFAQRHRKLVEALSRGWHDLAVECEEKEYEFIAERLKRWCEEVRNSMCDIPAELRLPRAAKEKLAECLAILNEGGDK